MELIKARNLLVLGAAMAAIGYIFSIATGSIGFIAFLAVWVLNYKELDFKKLLRWNNVYLLLIFFVVLLLNIPHSIDLKQANTDIVRHLPFLLLPVVFVTIRPFSTKERNVILKIFIHSLSLFFIVCMITAIIRQIGFWSRGGIFNWYYFYRYDFIEVFSQHPTYVSMFTLLSLALLLFRNKELKIKKGVFFASVILQIIAIILYGSRMGYILFVVLITLYFFHKFFEKQNRGEIVRIILIYFISMLALLIIAFNIPIVKERIFYTFGLKYEYRYNDQEFIAESSPEEQGRLLLWKDAWDLIKEKPIFGYGTGASRTMLLKKYEQEGHDIFLENQYNAHNTYLETLLIGGIPLLLAFVALVVSLITRGIKDRRRVVLFFGIIIALTGITETLFLAKGIMFIGFFYCLFLNKPYEK